MALAEKRTTLNYNRGHCQRLQAFVRKLVAAVRVTDRLPTSNLSIDASDKFIVQRRVADRLLERGRRRRQRKPPQRLFHNRKLVS